jgi:hypothetical protein
MEQLGINSDAVSAPSGESKTRRITRYCLRAALWLFVCYCIYFVYRAVHMPLRSYAGELKPLTSEELQLRDRMSGHVKQLAVTIGERNLEHYGALNASAAYLRGQVEQFGYQVTKQDYVVDGKTVSNFEVIVPGSKRSDENVVVGAHYDSVFGTPGANDNGSGVAAVLELARIMKSSKPERTIRFVFFVNEELPYFQTPEMGSFVYAKRLKQKNVRVASMVAVETIGCYFEAPGTQHYPTGFSALYPDKGNFIAFVGNTESRGLVEYSIRVFRDTTAFPSEAVAAPGSLTGIGWSDHWSFWQQGYLGIMITDTAPFRYSHYHQPTDGPEKLDYNRMARVVAGLHRVVDSLANNQSQ